MTSLKQNRTLLIIDDDRVLGGVIRDSFSDQPVEVLVGHTGAEGLAVCSKRKVDVVLLDQQLPDGQGHVLCPAILESNDRTKIIFITAFPSFQGAVEAIRLGAHDYLSKPFELEQLNLAIEKAFRTLDLERVEQFQEYRRDREIEETALIGGSAGLSTIDGLVEMAASAEAPVLLTGETGTGKDLVARTIHYRSPLRNAPFIEVNCAALPESLIEAELFGYEKGAFTGATTSKKGIFEMAEGGTLLLNEIGDMPLNLQSKLLGVLEGKRIKKLGGGLLAPINVRIIAATVVDLEREIGKSFREDLYYRLSVIRIHIPPLRERKQDLPDLCSHLLRRIAGGCDVRVPDPEIAKLMEYPWPGNVRELRNILERAFLLQKGPLLSPSSLLMTGGQAAKGPSLPTPPAGNGLSPLAEIEENYIRYALEQLSRNYTQTAKALGISLSTLKRKIREYGLN